MPRYRFSWDNLPSGLLHQLGSDLRLRPPVDQALRERYGARPEPDFVRDAWPTLIDAWLATDDESRELVVDELRARSEAQRRRAAVESLRLAVQRLERTHLTEEQDRRVGLERLRSGQTRLRSQMATTTSVTRRLENEIERRRIRAPMDGRLGEVAELRIGAFVAEGQRLGAIIPAGRLRVVAEFEPSSALGRIRPGQQARLRLVGFPWTEYGSIATTVDNVASEVRAGTVRVELTMQPDAASAVPFQHGMPGAVEIEVERLSPAALVLRVGGRLLTRPVRPPIPASAGGRG